MARPAPLDPTPEIIALAREVALEGWRIRAADRMFREPQDLSGSCKFTSQFAQRLFGGRLRGNEDHQFVELPSGERLDLNEEAEDLRVLLAKGHDPWAHDPGFWGNRDHRASMRSCLPRVQSWELTFRNRLEDLDHGLEPRSGF